MRVITIFLFVLGLVSLSERASAQAPNYELNNIRGSVTFVEQRLGTGDLSGARHYTSAARDTMAKANAATRSDPEFAKLKTKLDRLEKELETQEGGASKKQLADDKMREAESAARFAKLDMGSDEPEKAGVTYKKCVALLEEAFTADPTARDREIGGGPKGRELEKTCRDGVISAAKEASGENQQKADGTDAGKAAVLAFEAVTRAMEGKKLAQAVLVAGVRGMDECRNKLGQLTGLTKRNGKPYYDTAKETLKTSKGELTLAEIDKRCAKAQLELKTRTATGCGRKAAGISQQRLLGGGWGPIETQSGPKHMGYEGIPCSEMPKRSSFPGASASFKSKFQASCGPNAIYVVVHKNWVTSSGSRGIGADCYAKGQLGFFR